jgi:hypothetical protein
MAILLSCRCGKKLRIKDELAGKRIKCSGCDEILIAPAPPEEEMEVQVVEPTRVKPAARPPAPEPDEEPEAEPSYWVDPTALGGEIIALADEALLVASLKEKEFKRAKAALKKGEPADEVLAKPKTEIPYDRMKKVESNLHHRFIDVTWQDPEKKEETQTNLLCASPEDRDEIMKALHRRLGWKREVVEFSRLRAAWGPLVVIGVFGFITVCFTLAAANESKESSGTKVVRTNWLGAIFAWVFNIFGPVGAALLGTPFVLAGVVWLVMRMINPPIMLTLNPRRGAGRRPARE